MGISLPGLMADKVHEAAPAPLPPAAATVDVNGAAFGGSNSLSK